MRSDPSSETLPWIISVDDHVVEPPHLWQRWLPSRLRENGPRIVRASCETTLVGGTGAPAYTPGGDGPKTDFWVYEEVHRPIPQVMACVGQPREKLTLAPIAFEDMRPGCYDVTARLADMDLNHVEASVCFPNYPRFCGQVFLEARDKQLALACVRAYNDWMIEEWCGQSGRRLIPLCLIPLWDPQLAADEVRRTAALGCRAYAFSEQPADLNLPSVHNRDRHWDPFFAACDEIEAVVCMHIGSSSKIRTTSDDAPPGVRMALTFANAQSSMTDWLLSGVLARFARLRIAYSEGQIGWMPFLLERLDNIFTNSRAWAGLDSAITELPSSYIAGRVYGCFFEDDFGISVRDSIGIEQIAFETDYPHQDSTWPDSHEIVARLAQSLTPTELHRVVRGTAIEMFQLDVS